MSYGRGAAGVQGRSPRLIFGVTGLENVDFNNSRSLRGVCIPFPPLPVAPILPAGWEIKHAASDHVSTKTKSRRVRLPRLDTMH